MVYEFLLLTYLVVFLTVLPAKAQRYIRLLLRRIAVVCQRIGPGVSIVLAGVASVALNLLLWETAFYPVPATVDETAYLFGAETFAEGRLTNPTHPQHESLTAACRQGFLIHLPSWQMKFPPGQSLFLALGLLAGDPRLGILLCAGLAMSGLCWMLLGVLPLRWALLGTLLALLNRFLLLRWGMGYISGYASVLGGVLVYGALFRLLRQPKLRHGVIFGLGCVVLAYSRPYEGLLTSIPAALAMLWRIVGWRPSFAERLSMAKQGLVPASMVLAAGLGWLGYYQSAVTGSPFVMPYQIWNEQAESQSFTQLLNESGKVYEELRSDAGLFGAVEWLVTSRFRRSWKTALTMITPFCAIMLLGLVRVRWPTPIRIAFGASLLVSAGVLMVSAYWYPAEYFAPILGNLVLLVTYGCRGLKKISIRRRRVGATLGGLIPVCTVLLLIQVFVWVFPNRRPGDVQLQRNNVIKRLLETDGEHLVLVRYQRPPEYHEEWVNNSPAVDRQRIVWACELDADRNADLLKYYAGRKVWLLQPQLESPVLTPIDDASELHPRKNSVGLIIRKRFSSPERLLRLTASPCGDPTTAQWNLVNFKSILSAFQPV